MQFFHGMELSKLISKNNVSLPEPTLLSYNPKTIFYLYSHFPQKGNKHHTYS